MLTKEQERKALEKIEKMLAELGPDSYVWKAFEGCADLAVENIESDFWTSYKDLQESSLKASLKEKELRQKAEAEAKEAKERAREAEEKARQEISELKGTIKTTSDTLMNQMEITQTIEDARNKLSDAYGELEKELEAEKEKTAALEMEILKLKAKLYDFVVA